MSNMQKLIHKSIKVGLLCGLCIIVVNCVSVEEQINRIPIPESGGYAYDCEPNCSYKNKKYIDYAQWYREWQFDNLLRYETKKLNKIQREQGDW